MFSISSNEESSIPLGLKIEFLFMWLGAVVNYASFESYPDTP